MERCEKILVVEDNADIRDGLHTILEDHGYRIDTAAHGQEALVKLKATREPTLVLLDLMMPKMDGWEFLKAKSQDPALNRHRVVTVSAVDKSQWSGGKQAAEPDGNLSKPIDLEKLWEVVIHFCGEA
jgi:CheY-like chemotaxis protein